MKNEKRKKTEISATHSLYHIGTSDYSSFNVTTITSTNRQISNTKTKAKNRFCAISQTIEKFWIVLICDPFLNHFIKKLSTFTIL